MWMSGHNQNLYEVETYGGVRRRLKSSVFIGKTDWNHQRLVVTSKKRGSEKSISRRYVRSRGCVRATATAMRHLIRGESDAQIYFRRANHHLAAAFLPICARLEQV